MEINSFINNGEFKHIQVPPKNLKGHLPDFLLLGPQRTGTTWLAENLRKHPEILMSYPKELFYLSRLSPFTESFYKEKLVKAFDSKDWILTLQYLLQYIYTDILITKHFKKNDIRWYMSFFNISIATRLTNIINNKWYNPKVRGEATATNITINEDIIKELTALNPDIKGIIIVRDPVQRAWSHAKKDLVRNQRRKFEDVPFIEFKNFFNDEYQIRCGSYCENIDRWSKYLKPNHLLIIPFQDIISNPNPTMEKILNFLGVNADTSFYGKKLEEKINATDRIRIPTNYKNILNEMFTNEKRKLKERYDIDFSS